MSMDRQELAKKITAMAMPFVMGAFVLGNIIGVIQGYFIFK